MSLARKSLDGELRRPARLFSGRTGSWVQGGSSPHHGELLCNVPCAGGIKGLMLLWSKSFWRVMFFALILSIYFSERKSERVEFSLI